MPWLTVGIMFALLILAFFLGSEVLTPWVSALALVVGLSYLIIRYRYRH